MKIQGDIICRCRDEHGEILVAQDGNRRFLYFGGGIMQSAILTDRPGLLLEDYHEAMMCSLIFNADPRSILLIGLGGCSLVHFLMKAFPDCCLDVVEIRRQVIDLSHEYFFLPADSPRLRIFHASGEEFIQHRSADTGYDLIIADAFDEQGPASPLLEKDFLSSCGSRLPKNGVFVINLWNSPGHNFAARYRTIQDAFQNNALRLLLSESYRNAVAFGFHDPAMCRHLPENRARAAQLQARFGIKFPKYLKQLYWQNFDDQGQ